MSDSADHAHSGSAPDLRRRAAGTRSGDVDKKFTDFLLEFESLSLQIPPRAIKFKLAYSEENCEAIVMVSGCAYLLHHRRLGMNVQIVGLQGALLFMFLCD